MKLFLDSSILVEACLSQSPKFDAADALIKNSNACTSAHALAEAYATLSGDPRLKMHPADVSRMIEDLAKTIHVMALEVKDYRQLILSAPAKGIRGGMIYDAIHVHAARLCDCQEVYTLNVAHFRHVAPDLAVVGL